MESVTFHLNYIVQASHWPIPTTTKNFPSTREFQD